MSDTPSTALKTSPIGIFDSGIGGLSVVSEMIRILPGEDIVYFGDTARVPYGTKSGRAIIGFSREIAGFLVRKGVKVIIVACNSASAAAVPFLRKEFPVPIFDVIQPGAEGAARDTKTGRVGIIGTTATTGSRAYPIALENTGKKIMPFSKACPLFVPLVEEGLVDHDITLQAADHYLQDVRNANVDTLILGCTHYPLLEGVIQNAMGPDVRLVNSASETAHFVRMELERRDLLNPSLSPGERKYYLSDQSPNFQRLGSLFLDSFVDNVSVIEI